MKKLKDMHQIDGKNEKYVKSSLSQVWGDDGMQVYNTMNVGEYTDQLNQMSKADIQEHSIRLGVIPSDNLERLKKTLISQFNFHVAQYRVPQNPLAKSNIKKLSKQAADILAEGR